MLGLPSLGGGKDTRLPPEWELFTGLFVYGHPTRSVSQLSEGTPLKSSSTFREVCSVSNHTLKAVPGILAQECSEHSESTNWINSLKEDVIE